MAFGGIGMEPAVCANCGMEIFRSANHRGLCRACERSLSELFTAIAGVGTVENGQSGAEFFIKRKFYLLERPGVSIERIIWAYKGKVLSR